MAIALLWLFCINLGIAFGAGLYEHSIVVPEWLGVGPDGLMHWNAEAARLADTGRRFWVYVTTIPLTLLTIANLVVARHASLPARRPWLGAAMAALADRVVTFGYFIPTMIGLMMAPDSPDAVATAETWSLLNHGRHLLVLGAWLAALRALTLVHHSRDGIR